jgi:hypothetical protein
MFFKTKEQRRMSLNPSTPSFADYSQALERLQRRTALRRAVMSVGMGGSFEMHGGEDQERRDRELLDVWERHHGPSWMGC